MDDDFINQKVDVKFSYESTNNGLLDLAYRAHVLAYNVNGTKFYKNNKATILDHLQMNKKVNDFLSNNKDFNELFTFVRSKQYNIAVHFNYKNKKISWTPSFPTIPKDIREKISDLEHLSRRNT